MKRISPVLRQIVPAGMIVQIVSPQPGATDRHLRVRFKCHGCAEVRLKPSRWDQVKPRSDGTAHVKSCGCLAKKAFKTYWEKRAANFDRPTRESIFEAVVHRGARSAAEQFNIPKTLADFCYRLHRTSLLALPFTKRQSMYRLANEERWHLSDVAKKFGRTLAETRVVIREFHSSINTPWGRLVAKHLKDALSALREDPQWRTPGVFHGPQVIFHRNGDIGGEFGWLCDCLCDTEAAPSQVKEFFLAVSRTRKHRKEMGRVFAKKAKSTPADKRRRSG